MDAAKRYWLYGLATFAAGLLLGYSLHKCPEPISQTRSHSDSRKDSVKTEVRVRYVDVTPPEATIPAKKLPIHYEGSANWPPIEFGAKPDVHRLPYLELPFFGIAPFIDSSGYAEVSIDTSRGLTVRHSKRSVTVTDTSTYAAHERSSSDSSATVVQARTSPLKLTAYLLAPCFSGGVLGVHLPETKAVLVSALDLGEHWSLTVQPELYPVRLISDFRNSAIVYAGVGYKF